MNHHFTKTFLQLGLLAASLAGASAAMAAPVVSLLAKVSMTWLGGTTYDIVYKVIVQNDANAIRDATATLTAAGAGTSILDGSVVVGDIASNGTATPSDTITLRRDISLPLALTWSVTGSSRPLTCLELAQRPSNSLVGAQEVIPGTVTSQIVPAAGINPPYCDVRLTYSSGLEGPNDGYDVGQKQMIKVRVLLPLSQSDGGAGGVQGNWNGKQMVGAAGGNSSDINSWANFSEGTGGSDILFPIRQGYLASSTDTGQGNLPYAIITSGPLAGTIDAGSANDWAYRATHAGKVMAARVAKDYYGGQPSRVYFNGCSGGGGQGLGQLEHYGDEYDGALIGAPANQRVERFLGFDSWPPLVFRKLVQQGGTVPTTAQIAAANAAAVAACDVMGTDTVADGIIADPRACKFSARANICGAPGAPSACLTPAQADAIDRIWDGPRNRYGDRTFWGWDRGVSFSNSTTPSAAVQVMQWDHQDVTTNWGSLLFSDVDSAARSGISGAIAYDDEAALGAHTMGPYMTNRDPPMPAFFARGGKIIQIQGMEDPLINWRAASADYYARTATAYGNGTRDYASLQSWYRMFPVPGMGHCGGGAPQPVDPFLKLVDWVENGNAPDSLFARQSNNPSRTRKICPYPQTAIYNGSGSVDDAANYTCGGSLDTQAVVCDMVATKYGSENMRNLDFASRGVDPAMCPGLSP